METTTSDSPEPVIRVAGDGDVHALAELRALWAGDTGADPSFTGRMAAWLATEGERRTTWLAVVGDRPVGMASLLEYRRMPRPARPDSRWGYVGNLFVREESRNRGVGTALLAAVVATAEERAYARLVVSPSGESVSLYRRAGFVAPGAARGAAVLLVRPGAGAGAGPGGTVSARTPTRPARGR